MQLPVFPSPLAEIRGESTRNAFIHAAGDGSANVDYSLCKQPYSFSVNKKKTPVPNLTHKYWVFKSTRVWSEPEACLWGVLSCRFVQEHPTSSRSVQVQYLPFRKCNIEGQEDLLFAQTVAPKT